MKKTHENALLFMLALSPSGMMAQTAADTTIYKNVKLDSVVVMGKRPLITRDGTMDIVSVKGSYLSGMGTLGEMLAATPGLMSVGHNAVQVVGKGTPKFYVDGREVTQRDIFNTIRANNVARVEIEREPSSKYPAGTNAVVNIVTIKPVTDFISLNLYNTLSVRRKVSENPSFDFTYSRGKWASSISYDYDNSGNLNKETYFVEVFHPDYTFRSDEANHNAVRMQSHNITWSNDFFINDSHRLGFVYNFKHSNDRTVDTEQTAYKYSDRSEVKDILRREGDMRNLHNFSLSYSGDLTDNSSLDLSADYSLINSKLNYTSDETNLTSHGRSNVYTRSNGSYNIVTLNGSYSFQLPGKIRSEIGARYYNTHHPLDYATNNSFVDATVATNHQTMSDNVTAGYFRFRRGWRKFGFVVGGRYEYSDTRIRIKNSSSAESYSASRHTSDFLPSATLEWKLSKKFSLRAIYSRTVGRQGYQGLNPYPTYQDSLSYSAGNVNLRPEYVDRYNLYAFLGYDLGFGISYVNRYDGIENVTYGMSEGSNVITETPMNVHRSEHYLFTVTYRHTFGKVDFSGYAILTLPHDTYYFLGERYSVTKPYWEGNFNLSYRMAKNFTAYTSLSYQSFKRSDFSKQRRADNWSAGVQSNLLKNRLSLSLSVSDILHHANYNNVTRYFRNTCIGTYGTNDMRGVSLSLTYRLFNKNLYTSASSGSDEVLQRTE